MNTTISHQQTASESLKKCRQCPALIPQEGPVRCADCREKKKHQDLASKARRQAATNGAPPAPPADAPPVPPPAVAAESAAKPQGKVVAVQLLYIAQTEATPSIAKIGITKGTFEQRFHSYNRSCHRTQERKEHFAIVLPDPVARRIESIIKADYCERDDDGRLLDGEWVNMKPDRLRRIVVGLVFEHCPDAHVDLKRTLKGKKQLTFRREHLSGEEQ